MEPSATLAELLHRYQQAWDNALATVEHDGPNRLTVRTHELLQAVYAIAAALGCDEDETDAVAEDTLEDLFQSIPPAPAARAAVPEEVRAEIVARAVEEVLGELNYPRGSRADWAHADTITDPTGRLLKDRYPGPEHSPAELICEDCAADYARWVAEQEAGLPLYVAGCDTARLVLVDPGYLGDEDLVNDLVRQGLAVPIYTGADGGYVVEEYGDGLAVRPQHPTRHRMELGSYPSWSRTTGGDNGAAVVYASGTSRGAA